MPDDLPPSAEALAYEAKEVQLLLSKDLVQRALLETEQQIISEWKRAESTTDREACWNRLRGFLDWKTKLSTLSKRQPLQIAKD